MRDADEARYGRTSLLLLNVCPFTLRHVINDYYVKHGYTSLQDFLDKNKHDLYHILNRRCCCRRIQSRVTPMNRSQWDLLFSKNSSSCPKGYTGDCPCQYDAKPGVISDVMDITLCCLFIKNICTRHAGINMSHVDTIRTIRNHIIHAEKAHLDVLTYNGYWNRVRFALLDLANNVSPKVYTDTLNMIQELETRVMNASEIGEIRKLLVDQKRIEVLEEVCILNKHGRSASKSRRQGKIIRMTNFDNDHIPVLSTKSIL
ncbi:hypothetical protein FSP39_007662 [Pinctada imbricata]|uniref:DZIP3-like HEPN domain-containing protein n=1 Tax=Pinctada imbricata TaxID=66713 RepID=A0AA88XDV2_PINIB|nr:hypothetical protein FSP39_007662 [Pinctada imbricata]